MGHPPALVPCPPRPRKAHNTILNSSNSCSPAPSGSPDLIAARKVSDFLGTIHHEFTFTVEEGIDALYDLIWHIESYEQVGGRGCCWWGCRCRRRWRS